MNTTRRRMPTRLAAVALVVAFGASACESRPSAKRVAVDLVESLAETPEVRDCMLKVIDGYSKAELDAIGTDFTKGDTEEKAAAAAALKKFQEDLAGCR